MRRQEASLLLVASILLLWSSAAADQERVPKTAMSRGDARQSGAYDVAGPAAAPAVKWSVRLAGQPNSLVLSNGMLLCSTKAAVTKEGGEPRAYLYAIDANTGQQRWSPLGLQSPAVAPAVVGDRILLAEQTGALFVLDRDAGQTRQKTGLGSYATSPLVVAADGVFVGTNGGYVVHADPSLEHMSRIVLAERSPREPELGNIWSPPAVRNGVLYASTTGQYLFAVRIADGTTLWKVPVEYMYTYGRRVDTRVCVDGAYVLYARDLSHLVCASADTGEARWEFPVKPPFISGFSVSEGNVFVADGVGEVIALDLVTGQARWRFKADSPAGDLVVDRERVYFGTEKAGLYALDMDDGSLSWRMTLEAPVVGSPGPAASVLYVATADGRVYALADPSQP